MMSKRIPTITATRRAEAARLKQETEQAEAEARRLAKKAKKTGRAGKLARLKNPRSGVKPPDPIVQPPSAPGMNVDDWREQS